MRHWARSSVHFLQYGVYTSWYWIGGAYFRNWNKNCNQKLQLIIKRQLWNGENSINVATVIWPKPNDHQHSKSPGNDFMT